MNKNTNMNSFDLEDRTLEFGKRIIRMCKELIKDVINLELIKQIMRSGTSIGSNYREANEALSKKDFLHRMKISRKEAKETTYWLELIIEANSDKKDKIESLLKESRELRNILSSIITKSEK